ncbi:ABC transporter permease [Pseudooceanicola sp. CBS1P-1]|uniref:ABC transporter permease subunit n=1 Tax=Pseudooceanicola albus TaxID=2692189 RepID=A0A6L7G305_9RHOB|nr:MULTISPECIES: ABC transporter permease [Pseudooceanicola]MBT9385193.1 ABC transporter permease [Pseudooceanicola endophyticus]MXN18515.1 ABC transporter permease subunit [Pseudooceanicola albus]
MTKMKTAVAAAEANITAETLMGPAVPMWKRTWQRLLRKRSGQVGLFIIGFMVVIALAAPILAPYDPDQVLIGVEHVKRREAPCIHLLGCEASKPQHIMGTDENVRDVYSRILYGARISLMIGIVTVSVSLIFGVLIGAVAGFFGGWTDTILMRFMDVILGFPSLLLAIAIVAVLGPGIQNALLAVSIVSLPAYARVTRASVLSVKTLDFVAASQLLGASRWRILFRRVLPNALTPIVVLATLGIATSILDAAGLSFLGLGAQPPMAEWGTMLGSAKDQIFSAPHLVFFPGIAIMLTVLGFNLLGDGLRDALDTRLN